MGKRYHCDYCDKTMVSSPSIIKTHNKGLIHQKLVQEHYQQFKDPETILVEEHGKRPCVKFARGECKFGTICHFSHYTREELEGLRNYVAAKKHAETFFNQPSFEHLYQKLQDERSKSQVDDKNTVLCDRNGAMYVFPWTYNPVLDSYGDHLPPSVRRFKMEDFTDVNITGWG